MDRAGAASATPPSASSNAVDIARYNFFFIFSPFRQSAEHSLTAWSANVFTMFQNGPVTRPAGRQRIMGDSWAVVNTELFRAGLSPFGYGRDGGCWKLAAAAFGDSYSARRTAH